MYGKQFIDVIDLSPRPNVLLIGLYEDWKLDNVADELVIILRVDKQRAIDRVVLNVFAITGTPTYQLILEGTSAGETDDTDVGGGSPTAVDFAPGGTGMITVSLTNSYSTSVGELIAIRIKDGTTGNTPDASNHNATFRAISTQYVQGIPYAQVSTDTGVSWSDAAPSVPIWAMYASGDATDQQGFPLEAYVTFGNPTDGDNDITAAGFKLDTSLGRRVQIGGGFIVMSTINNYAIGIYDEDGNAVAESAEYDSATLTGSSNAQAAWWTPTWIDTGVMYYLGVRQAEAGAFGIATYNFDFNNNNALSCFHGYPDAGAYVHEGVSWVRAVGEMPAYAQLLVTAWDAHGIEMQHLDAGMIR